MTSKSNQNQLAIEIASADITSPLANYAFNVESKIIGSKEVPAIKSSEIHVALEVKTEHRAWIDRRISEYNFVENQDFIIGRSNLIDQKGRGGDRRTKEVWVTIEMAKMLCMIERTPISHKVRQYFIQVEDYYNKTKTGRYIPEEKTNNVVDSSLEIQFKIAELNLIQTKIACAERLADRIISTFPNLQENSKQQLLAHAYSTVTQSEVNYLLPIIEKKKYTATELAEKYGKSVQSLGKILNQLGLKAPEFAECRLSKSKYSDKQVEQYFYFETVLSILNQFFKK